MSATTAPTPTNDTTIDLGPLHGGFSGDLHTAADPGWDEARSAWNLAVDQHPARVAMPADAADVAAAVAFARDRGLRVAAQGTGHNAAAYGDLDRRPAQDRADARRRRSTRRRRTARVECRRHLGRGRRRRRRARLAALAGSSHDVGVVGYSLGGGVSWLAPQARTRRRAASPRSSSSAPTARRRVDARHDPDLFWALRGGGGNFGVVTAIEFGLLPISEVYAGGAVLPARAGGRGARGVARAGRRRAGRGHVGRPADPVPAAAGGPGAAARALVRGDRGDYPRRRGAARELLAPLRELGPAMDTFATVAAPDLLALHMDPPEPVPGLGDHQMLRRPRRRLASARLVEAVGPGSGSPLLSFEFRHLGGALGRRGEGSGALGALGGEVHDVRRRDADGSGDRAPLRSSFAAARDALDAVDSGKAYSNFAESAVEPEAIFGERTLARLREIRASVDPEGMFVANHSIDRT